MARVDEHSSRYQGFRPPWVAEEMERVNIELVSPSQLQLSSFRPPLPLAQTKMDPLP